jgi:hypothetical protein
VISPTIASRELVEKYDMVRRDAVLPDTALYLNVIDCAVWAAVSRQVPI